jgi:hypothetical protein
LLSGYGHGVYSAQGQFAYNPAYQGMSLLPCSPHHLLTSTVAGIPAVAYRFQTLGNAVSFISALIAALLYGNIGIKIFYSAVLRDVFRLPPLDERYGKLLWVALGKFTRLPVMLSLLQVLSFLDALCRSGYYNS